MPGQSKPLNPEKEIIRAAKSGATARVKELLKQDPALIAARDTDGSTPLHCATWKGHLSVVELLLSLGADVNARNNNAHWGTTPLHAAALLLAAGGVVLIATARVDTAAAPI